MKRILVIGIGVGVIAASYLAYTLYQNPSTEKQYGYWIDDQGAQGHSLIINPERAHQKEIRPFTQKLNQLIEQKIKKEKLASKIAVHFRDLNNGPAFGVNNNEYFVPASLLKVPVLIGFLKQAESFPEIFEQKILFDSEKIQRPSEVVQNIAPEKQLQNKRNYTVEQMLYYMIVYSDNRAIELLGELNGEEYTQQVLDDLGIEIGQENDELRITVRQYASFFRILYNASYLSPELSQKALYLLTLAQYKEGLLKHIPPDIQVAHKFGEREISEDRQLHDCGIVYYPKHPYLLCILTRGSDRENLKKVIQDVSKFVFEQVSKN